MEMLQHFLDSKLLLSDHIFYLLIKNAVLYARLRLECTNDLAWDTEILQFVETIEFYGHESVVNLIRGPGHLGEGRVDPKASIGRHGTCLCQQHPREKEFPQIPNKMWYTQAPPFSFH